MTGLSKDQLELYGVLLAAAQAMKRQRPTHWANRNFQKAQAIGLGTFSKAKNEIMNDHWNFFLQNAGQPTLHNISLQAVKVAVSNRIRDHDDTRPDDNPDF